MCGIFGVFGDYYKGSDNLDLNLLKHRGPDAYGMVDFPEKKVLLAHTRLSIIDIDMRSNQPMISSCGRFYIIYNGEIFNFLTLKKDLEKHKLNFNTLSDTEVILNGYKKYGLKFFNKLNGIFSFAIYDKFKNITHIVRDKSGVKPLYYKKKHDSLIFSSEIKPIISYLNEKVELDFKSLTNHLVYNFAPSPNVIFKDIKKLMPGHIKTFVGNKLTTTFNLKLKKNRIIKSTHNQLMMDFENVLKKSIMSQTISDAPLGSFLSGGLDSSTILYYASKSKPNMETFCISGNWDKGSDKNSDLYNAKIIANQLSVNLNIVNIDDYEFFKNLQKMIFYLEEPICDPAVFSTYIIAKKAKDLGIKVLLSGTGGDEILGGYRRHIISRYAGLLRFMPMNFLKLINHNYEKIFNKNLFSRRIKRLFNVIDKNKQIHITNLLQWHSMSDIRLILNKSYHPFLKENYFSENINKSSFENVLEVDKKYFLPDHNFNYTDKMSMACGVEIRVPLVDDSIRNFLTNISNNKLVNKFETKWLLKKIMEKNIPKDIVYRKKIGFGLPIHKWINTSKYSYVFDNLTSIGFQDHKIFSFVGIKNLIDRSRKGDEQASLLLYAIQCIDFWEKSYKNKNKFELY